MRYIFDGRREAGGLRDVAEQRDLASASAAATDLHPLATGRGMNAAIVCWTPTSTCNRLAASGDIWPGTDANGDWFGGQRRQLRLAADIVPSGVSFGRCNIVF
jgi:hypothetical protein